MFNANDQAYLLRAIGQNQVVLFLGAGFSQLAKNGLGRHLPIGSELATIFWEFLGYKEPYDNTPLPDVYDAVLASGRPHEEITALLQSHLTCVEVPKEYDTIPKVFWFRIYTTNIDNLMDEVFRHAGTRLDVLAFPKDETRERDQTLERFQLVHLNGRLPCRPDELTFSIRQYARRATPHDPLYEQFVTDYATKTTIFVGTELNEPLFWQYIETRSKRPSANITEHRPKSFLISPRISPPKKDALRAFNIMPVEGTVSDFLAWLGGNSDKFPSRIEVLRATLPGLAEILHSSAEDRRFLKELKQFAVEFHHIPLEPPPAGKVRSLFLLGATPKWEDLLCNLDAPRTVTGKLFQDVERFVAEENRIGAFMILGSAGCGKSTILRRLGIRLARAGQSVYLTNSEDLLPPQVIARALESIDRKAVLLFDNAETVLGGLPGLIEELRTCTYPPLLIVASRTNDYDRRISRFMNAADVSEFHVPNLDRVEIESIINILEVNNLLGRLQGMPRMQRIAEFEERANKQVLVAMREATSGRLFDEIINDEFIRLDPRETKILYLCVALATDAGYRITKQEFVGCSDSDPAEALYILERSLRDIVLPTGPNDDLLLLRHRRIAEYMVDQAAPRPLLREAYLRLLSVLAGEIRGRPRRSRSFGFYRDLVNHHTIFKRFEEDVEEARSIYDSLSSRFKGDFQFWLQYGSLELTAGNLELAENYLSQADSLDPGNDFISNAIGHLFLRKAIKAKNKAEAIKFRDEGAAILLGNIERIGADESYCFHIYCAQRLIWVKRWAEGVVEQQHELEELRVVCAKGAKLHPRDRRIRDAGDEIEKEYLSLAIPRT